MAGVSISLHSTWHHLIRRRPTLAFPTTNPQFPRSLPCRDSTSQPYKTAGFKHLQQSTMSSVELTDVSDFDQIVSSDGTVSICGFGSLLSERSARSTFPDLINFRVGRLNGFRRVFAHVAPIFYERGIANPETKIPSFIEREHEFRFLAVLPATLDGNPHTTSAVLCARYSDDEYFQNRCKGSKAVYYERYGRFNIHKIWRDDVLPCRVYLRHCVLAAKNLGNAAFDNFLDHTYLGDRTTTIREYLATKGSSIMEEEPPELLKTRYGG